MKKRSKLQRTETMTLRLNPKLRYLLELAARTQRRTVSSYIESSIDQSLNYVLMDESSTTLAEVANEIWDVDAIDRLNKLADTYPELLTFEEQALLEKGSLPLPDPATTRRVRERSA